MRGFAEYAQYDGLGLAELVRTKQVSSTELVEAAIECIQTLNPQLNAVIHTMYDRGRKAASRPLPQGPFSGVPFLLKDLGCWFAGEPATAGSRSMRHFVPDHDSELVRRFRGAGLVVLGKTNTPEFGLSPVTEPKLFGPTANPWDPSCTPSGSSGGSAVAVAARMVPVASGSDGGGSLRAPAAACGVFGLKPSRGRNPTGPNWGEFWHGLACEHVLTRSVRDSAAMLDVTAGPDTGAPYHAPPPERPFLQEVGTDPGRLRIAFTTDPLLGKQVDPACIAAVRDTAALLADLGHIVTEAAPTVERRELLRAYLTVICGELATDMDAIAELCGPASTNKIELTTRAMALIGRACSAVEFNKALRYLHRVGRHVAGFFATCDLLLTPCLGKPSLPIGALDLRPAEAAALKVLCAGKGGSLMKRLDIIRHGSTQAFDFCGHTALFNVTGQPAMSVPLCWSDTGMPIGMQFAARYGDEATLFRLAAQLETARPWAQRKPRICAGPRLHNSEHV